MAVDFTISLPAQGPPGPSGADGANGVPGDTGPRGPSLGICWDYIAYDPAGPLPGQFMLDDTGGPITAVLFERHERNGGLVTNWLTSLGSSTNLTTKGHLTLTEIADDSNWMLLSITDEVTEYIEGIYEVPVSYVSGSVLTFTAGTPVVVGYFRSGDKGTDGAGGDMFGANNLSELTNFATAFNRIKQDATTSASGTVLFPQRYLAGLKLSNAAIDLEHDITVATGVAASSANAALINLASAITKRIDAAWTLGNDGGGLDTGTVATGTWYYVYLIRRSDTGVVDACFSASNSAPTTGGAIPAAYDQYRRIGAVRTDGSANILAFIQDGDRFIWKVPAQEYYSGSSLVGARTLITLNLVPRLSECACTILNVALEIPEGTQILLITDPAQDDTSPSNSAFTIYSGNSTSGIVYSHSEVVVRTDSSGRIGLRTTLTSWLIVSAKGFIDRRGQ